MGVHKNVIVSVLRLILVGFGNQKLTTVVIAPVPVYCLSTAVKFTPCVGNYDMKFWGGGGEGGSQGTPPPPPPPPPV